MLDQLRSGELSVSEPRGTVALFEDEFARFHGMPYALSAGSGTAALHAAYFALDLEAGDEVLAPTYTHLATVLPMLHVGLVPVLCDVEEDSGNIDIADAERRLSDRTRAIVVTHQYGRICDVSATLALAERAGLRVIEDCSHAHGATRQGRLAGTFGDIACFSLQAEKAVPAGEGGILISRDARLFERASLLGHFRRPTPATSKRLAPFVETGYGLKSRLHPLAAALARVQLRKLPERIELRAANLRRLEEGLAGVPGVEPLRTPAESSRGGCFRFVLRYAAAELSGLRLDRYVEALHAEGAVEARPGHLVKPLHLTPLLQTLDDHMYRSGWPRRGPHITRERKYRDGDFPGAERFSAGTLQLPAFTDPDGRIVEAYVRAMGKLGDWAAELAEGPPA